MITRIKAILIGFVLMVMIGAFTAVPAQAAPYCGITWGSTAKVQTDQGPVTDYITNVRAGRHACYDRLVVDIGNTSHYTGYNVRYVNQISEDPTGNVIATRGGARLQIIVNAEDHNRNGIVTYRHANKNELVNVSAFTTFRQVVWAGSFEGQSTVGLGVRGVLPFRVFVLHGNGTSNLVIDVAHRWQ